jgi:hypothetical protein
MKLILHIGTHKTGSSALQRHLQVNSALLSEWGIHYAAPDSAITSNAVADALSAGRIQAVRDFFNAHVEMAKRNGARTVLVSAENFYGMTIVSALRRKRSSNSAIVQERALVRQLKSLIPPRLDDHNIVCYFRRPDHFVESWYNQNIKGSSLFDGTFPEFLRIVYPTLLYNSVFRIWADAFGQHKCAVRLYEECDRDILSDFLGGVLEVDKSKFVRETATANERLTGELVKFFARHANERLSRDLVEFKREKNATTSRSEKATQYRTFGILEKRLEAGRWEPRDYRDFLSPHERAELLNSLKSEMTKLQSSYNLSPFPTFDVEETVREWMPYPGLSRERREEIEREYRKIQKSWRLRLGDRVRRYSVNRGQQTALVDAEVPERAGLGAKKIRRRTAE